jgi:hypothetical protein
MSDGNVTASGKWQPGLSTAIEDMEAAIEDMEAARTKLIDQEPPWLPTDGSVNTRSVVVPMAAVWEWNVRHAQDEAIRREAAKSRRSQVVFSDATTPSGRATRAAWFAAIQEAAVREERDALTATAQTIADHTGLHPDDVLRALRDTLNAASATTAHDPRNPRHRP